MSPMSDIQIGWQDYLAIALRRRVFFFVPVVISMAIGVVVVVFSPRIYEANALIAVQNEKLINPLIQGLAMPMAVSDRLQTLREEILSWANLNRLIALHQLDAHVRKGDPVAFEQLIKQLRQDVKVKMKGQTLIQVSYEGRERAKVQDVVNSLTDIVIERSAAIQEQEANTAVSFIEAELSVYRQKLEESEHKLREFKELYMTQMPIATALNDQLKDLEVDLSNLLIDNTPLHPRVIEVKRKIDEVRKQRDEEIRRLVAKGVLEDKDPALYEELLDEMSAAKQAASASAAASAAAQKAQQAIAAVVEGLEAPEVAGPTGGSQVAVGADGSVQINDAAAASLTLAPRQQQELTRLTRDYTVNESIYRGLLEKLERAKITGRLGGDEEGGKFVVVERARFPLRPIKPQPVQVLFMALMTGIALGVALVVLVEYLDQSVQSSEEAAELLEVPVLGAISTIVTQADLEARRHRRKQWTSFKELSTRFRSYVVQPVWTRIDKALVHWGL